MFSETSKIPVSTVLDTGEDDQRQIAYVGDNASLESDHPHTFTHEFTPCREERRAGFRPGVES